MGYKRRQCSLWVAINYAPIKILHMGAINWQKVISKANQKFEISGNAAFKHSYVL